MLKRKLDPRRGAHTHPLIWLVAILCAVLAVVVILTGLVVFIVYMIYQPRMPYLAVGYAHLNRLDYDQSGLLTTAMAISIVAENDNVKAHATFSDMDFVLQFQGIEIAELKADPFDVANNSSVALNYEVPSSLVPLDEAAMDTMDAALREDKVPFHLEGQARTRWRVGMILSVKLWTHLSCPLQFSFSNGSSIKLYCTSKSH